MLSALKGISRLSVPPASPCRAMPLADLLDQELDQGAQLDADRTGKVPQSLPSCCDQYGYDVMMMWW